MKSVNTLSLWSPRKFGRATTPRLQREHPSIPCRLAYSAAPANASDARRCYRFFLLIFLLPFLINVSLAQAGPSNSGSRVQTCPRFQPGDKVSQPAELRSHGGVLELTLHFKYQRTISGEGPPRYCYVTDDGVEDPTLRVHPGDRLILHLRNDLLPTELSQGQIPKQPMPTGNCDGGPMSASATNVHFHGMNIPPTCHQDDVLHTLVQAGQSFDYDVRIPPDEPPGLYWYHPHLHGFGERQVQGGASGALIVEGIERTRPSLAKLPQRLLILRDQPLTDIRVVEPQTPAWDISINSVPVIYPRYQPAILQTPPETRELWRVLNAGADTIFNLQVVAGGKPQPLQIVAIDGVPTGKPEAPVTSVLLPPGSRSEFIVTTPKAGEPAQLVTTDWDTGPEGDRDPARPIADIVSGRDTPTLEIPRQEIARAHNAHQAAPGNPDRPVVERRLYFSQVSSGVGEEADTSVFYYVTVVGQQPQTYRMGLPPDIVTHEGDVEDWIVENRSQEDHVFHIHQLHFRVLDIDGQPVHDDALRDTINVPHWTGTGPYPTVKLRMDFRDPNLVGTFPYHCHILRHSDMGMMGTVRVLPQGILTATTLAGPRRPVDVATVISVSATVKPRSPGDAQPSGTVQFILDGIRTGAPVGLVSGKATFSSSFEESGTHTVEATYSGDATHNESVSPAIKIRVSGSF